MAVSRLLQQLLRETAPTDISAYAITITMILVVALVATIGPARRAGRADPLAVLRN
jgi:ABC-type lipoprotein release transport system permease subunit